MYGKYLRECLAHGDSLLLLTMFLESIVEHRPSDFLSKVALFIKATDVPNTCALHILPDSLFVIIHEVDSSPLSQISKLRFVDDVTCRAYMSTQ